MTLLEFPAGFLWGAASASYQVEGAAFEGGREESIWDRFCAIPGNVLNGDSGKVACDQYHLYKEDIALMKRLGLQSYRFSIAWPRVRPRGKENQAGMDYYSRLIDELLEAGIKPLVTLYHWDLPQRLQDIGGWANPETALFFADYAAAMFESFGDRVPYWMTLNEPFCTAYLGNFWGIHAPGIRDFSTSLRVSYHLYTAHAFAVEAFRHSGAQGEIGIALNLAGKRPFDTASERDIEAAGRADLFQNAWFLDPIFKGTYPADLCAFYEKKGVVLPPFRDEELALMHSPLDFLAVNYYGDQFVKHAPSAWPLETQDSVPPNTPASAIGWPVTPDGLTKLLRRLSEEWGVGKILISENGLGEKENVSLEGEVHDPERIDYTKRHLAAIHAAIESGVNVAGYTHWSFSDNFEWAAGYGTRFGLVYIDYPTQRRILKSSAKWYSQVIANNAVEVP